MGRDREQIENRVVSLCQPLRLSAQVLIQLLESRSFHNLSFVFWFNLVGAAVFDGAILPDVFE